jgi:hypothetical protein
MKTPKKKLDFCKIFRDFISPFLAKFRQYKKKKKKLEILNGQSWAVRM